MEPETRRWSRRPTEVEPSFRLVVVPVEVAYATGSVTGEPARFVPPTEETTVEGIATMLGQQRFGIPIELTDPRLTGLLSHTSNGAGQEFADGWGQIETRT